LGGIYEDRRPVAGDRLHQRQAADAKALDMHRRPGYARTVGPAQRRLDFVRDAPAHAVIAENWISQPDDDGSGLRGAGASFDWHGPDYGAHEEAGRSLRTSRLDGAVSDWASAACVRARRYSPGSGTGLCHSSWPGRCGS